MDKNLQFCTFYLDGLLYGVKLAGVQEVIHALGLTQVPLAPKVVNGLINLRGQIVTAVDLRRCLELEPRQPNSQFMNVVVSTDDGPVSLLVDEIGDVVEVEDSTFEQPPGTMKGTARNVITGVYKLRGRLMHVLDIEKACRFAEIPKTNFQAQSSN